MVTFSMDIGMKARCLDKGLFTITMVITIMEDSKMMFSMVLLTILILIMTLNTDTNS